MIEQILELINPSDCNEVFSIRKDKLDRVPYHRIPGVYILFNKDEIVYIGSTGDLFERVLHHKNAIPYSKKLTKPMKWDSAIFIAMNVDRDVYFKNEQKLIEFFKPKYNRQYITDENKKILINQDIEEKTRSYKNVIDILIDMHLTNAINNQGNNFDDILKDFLSNFNDKQVRIRIKKKCLKWFQDKLQTD
jgi:predicted GIY-YIG superfamily endonuclease